MADRNDEEEVRTLDYMKRYRRNLVRTHNGLHGSAAMTQVMCKNIAFSMTTTAEAKSLAAQINALTVQLREALKTRIDP